jgi:hypothetical protein
LVEDATEVERLMGAKERRASVTLRCAMLDVTGQITKDEVEGRSHKFLMAVEGVTYRKPKHPWEGVVYRRRGPA